MARQMPKGVGPLMRNGSANGWCLPERCRRACDEGFLFMDSRLNNSPPYPPADMSNSESPSASLLAKAFVAASKRVGDRRGIFPFRRLRRESPAPKSQHARLLPTTLQTDTNHACCKRTRRFPPPMVVWGHRTVSGLRQNVHCGEGHSLKPSSFYRCRPNVQLGETLAEVE